MAKDTIAEEKTVVNESNQNQNEDTKSKSPFFDFFKTIQPQPQQQQSQPNTSRTLEGILFLNVYLKFGFNLKL